MTALAGPVQSFLGPRNSSGHDTGEQRWDTLDPEGSYDYFPLSIWISGREALQEHWRRLFGNPAMFTFRGDKIFLLRRLNRAHDALAGPEPDTVTSSRR